MMTWRYLNLLALSTFLLKDAALAKVVVMFSVPHTSHVRTYTNVARALTQQGHTTYVCVPQFMLDTNLVDTHAIRVIVYGQYLKNCEDVIFGKILDNFWRGESGDVVDYIALVKKMQSVIRQILSDKPLMKQIKDLKPDLLVLSNFSPFRNFVTISHVMDVPFVYLGPHNDLPGQRVPFSPSSVPCPFYQGFSERGMSFMDRLKTASCNLFVAALDYYFMDDKIVQEFAPHRPRATIGDISRRAQLYIIESDHILDFPKPELPNMKLIGSTAVSAPKPLSEPFKSFADASRAGIAVVSFGSSVLTIPKDVSEKMISAFLQQDLDVVWRVNLTSPQPERVLTSHWLPQSDLLAHPSTKLLVSHCGTHSQYEALYHAVPILCMPLIGEQFFNAHRSKSKGFGLTANILETSDKRLARLMKRVVESDKYRGNIERASEFFRMLYKEPDKSAAFWINHVIEYGGRYMKSAAQDMPVYQFLVLDGFGVVMVTVLAVIAAIFLFCWCCCRASRRVFGKLCKWMKFKLE